MIDAKPLSDEQEKRFRERPDVWLIPRLLATLDAARRELSAERTRRERAEAYIVVLGRAGLLWDERAERDWGAELTAAHEAWLAARPAPGA